MSERGVFAVDRGIWADADFADEVFSEREAFLWMLSEAAWRPTRVRIGANTVDLARGQLAFSTRFMAAKWKWSEARVRRYLGRLISAEIVCTTTDKIATHVTILKYDRFQRVSLPDVDAATHERRTSDAPSTHLRRKEEDREYKETTSLRSVVPRPKKSKGNPRSQIEEGTQPNDRQREDAEGRNVRGDEFRMQWRRFRDHHLREASNFADWNAAWRTWLDSPIREREAAQRARASPGGKPSSNGALSRAADLLGIPNEQRPASSATRDFAPVIDHEGNGRPDRQVFEPAGGSRLGFQQEAHLRLVSAYGR